MAEIIQLWQSYNAQLAALIRTVDTNSLQNVWHTADSKEVTLEFLMVDYLKHLRHHLAQIL